VAQSDYFTYIPESRTRSNHRVASRSQCDFFLIKFTEWANMVDHHLGQTIRLNNQIYRQCRKVNCFSQGGGFCCQLRFILRNVLIRFEQFTGICQWLFRPQTIRIVEIMIELCM
jgi:hypothetical protein